MPPIDTERSATTDASIGSHPRVPAPAEPQTGSRSGNPVPEASVAAMFDGIAPIYDRLNTVLTFGRDGRWRRRAVEAAGLQSGGSVLDAACGTGKLAAQLADRVGPFGRVLAVDLSPGMVTRGVASYADLVQLEFRVGNALALPAANGEFDAATIAFGMRNLADFEAGFRELRRVVRPGGRVVCLELTTPRPAWWGRLFLGTFRRVAPLAGRLFGQDAAYRYLPASLDGFPDPERLSSTMRAAGLTDIRVRRMALRSVALHIGTVPRD
jgi:demethylmenaquinone methyltransferase/2-methoxy-6-polyprenyl-1,4-benzoquinol methylase